MPITPAPIAPTPVAPVPSPVVVAQPSPDLEAWIRYALKRLDFVEATLGISYADTDVMVPPGLERPE